jgi:predicted amidophosphoribosyltransferase
VAPALRLDRGVRDSAGLGAADRVANLAGRVRCHPPGAPQAGTTVVLLDDVVTTGATVAACVRALSAAGVPTAAILTLTAA